MALKVIELLIDDSLTGETKVEEIALVLQPAIETEFVYFNQQDYAEIGERGGIKESRKAPKSDTPNPNPKGEGTAKGDASSTRGAEVSQRVEDILKNKSDDFNERYKDKLGYGVNVGMLKSVYQRGVGAYNVSHSPRVQSAEQWALARVNAFLYLVKNGRPENSKYKGDNDLLPTDHPKRAEMTQESFQESYSDYPEAVKNNAQKVLNWTEENGWGSCGTPVGKQRANQLAKGEPISLETIKRMFSYLSRHKVDLESSKSYDDGCGLLMYDSWGGQEALGWAERKLKQVEEEMGYDVGSLTPYVQTTGTTKMSEYEMDVYGYKTKYFYICPGAQGTFKDILSVKPSDDSIGMIRSAAVVADKVFEIESKVLDDEYATEEDLNQAIVLVKDFKDIILQVEKIHRKKYDVSYMDGHIETIKSYVGREEMEGLGDVAGDCGCGCWDDGTYPLTDDKLYFGDTMINGMPVYENEDEALEEAKKMGCEGTHIHTIDGKDYYMPCEVHPETLCGCGGDVSYEEEFGEYTEEEFEAAKLLKYLAETDYQKFESVVGAMRGATETELKRRNHRVPTNYFKYERVLDGFPDRDFCTSIEGRYFRRLEIDLLRDVNRDFGHKREPYSKWLYKGGPNCVHAWRKFLVQGQDLVDMGMAEGKAGTPPKNLPNNGYYSEETKKASEKAYAISQQQMTRQSFDVIIVDIDDTLITRGGSPMKKTIDYINKKWNSNRIVVVSGRDKSNESQTRRQLERAGVKVDDVYLSDFPQGPNASRAFKEYKAKWLMDRGFRIVEAIDNDSDTRRDYSKLGIKVTSPVSLCKEKKLEFKVDGEKRMIYSPAMKPGILIPRIDEATKERYFVTFKPETIERMAQRYMIDKRSGGGHTNYEHSDMKFEDVYLVESWIVEGDQDKAYALGYDQFQVPRGTWMVGFRVDDDKVWEMVKNGEIKGISIEGNFEYKFSSTETDEYLLKEIINIINQIK